MAIFDKDQPGEKTDAEKISVNTIEPYIKDGEWVFDYQGRTLQFAPARMTDAILSPVVVGADKILKIGADLKGIKNCEDGIVLSFSDEYFPGADAKFTLLDDEQYGGQVYDVEALNLKGVPENQKAWVCPYMNLYFSNIPKTLYLRIEEKP